MKKHAFTLLELIIVIVVMGVLASLAVPRFLKMIYSVASVEAFTQISAINKHIAGCLDRYGGLTRALEIATFKECDSYGEIGMDSPPASSQFIYKITYDEIGFGGSDGYTLIAETKDFSQELTNGGACGGQSVSGGRVAINYSFNQNGGIQKCGMGTFSNVGNTAMCEDLTYGEVIE